MNEEELYMCTNTHRVAAKDYWLLHLQEEIVYCKSLLAFIASTESLREFGSELVLYKKLGALDVGDSEGAFKVYIDEGFLSKFDKDGNNI